MQNSSCHKKISDYRKNMKDININNIGFPNINDRIVILETISTGPNPKGNNIIEISCMEMMGGKITGYEFDAFLHPRHSINEVTKQKTNLNNNFYDEYYKDVYASDKNVFEQFKKFVGKSKIVSYNGIKEMNFINNELIYHKMYTISKDKFYNISNIFKQMFPKESKNIFSLSKCCNFLEINLPKEKFHTSKMDCFAVAKIMSKLYDIINKLQSEKENQIQENNENESNKINESQVQSYSGIKSDKSLKNSENEFEYSDSLIDIIEENSINDENRSENIINNPDLKKVEKGNINKADFNYDIKEKKEKEKTKFLNNKRKGEFDNLIKNLKNKVNPEIKEDTKEIKKIEKELNESEFKQIKK